MTNYPPRDLRARNLAMCPAEDGTNRHHVDSTFLADRETQVKMFAELGAGSSIVFTFEGGLSGSHSITEDAHSAAAWKRAYAHWEGYISANNDTLKRRAKVEAERCPLCGDDVTAPECEAAEKARLAAAAPAPKVKAKRAPRAQAERVLKRYRYRLVNTRNREDSESKRIDSVDAYTKTEARALIAEEYRNNIPPAKYGFYPFSAHRIVWLSEDEVY